MAGTLFENNLSPYLTLVESSAPSSPSAGNQRVYIDTSDHHLKRKNSGGSVTDLESGGGGGSTPTAHGVRATRITSNFSVGNNTLTAVQWNGEDFDTDTMHDTGSNTTKIVIPSISGVTTGLWTFTVSGYTDQNGGSADAQFKLNGTTVIAFSREKGDGAALCGLSLSTDYVCSATDYIECLVRTTAGSGNIIGTDASGPAIFSAKFIGKVS
jgi:hypothetical protein